MSQNSADRRQFPRLDKSIPLKISSGECDIVTETQNLSRNGVFCETEQSLPLMTKLKIHLLIPSASKKKNSVRKITCQGIVVRVEAIPGSPKHRVAIFFNDIQKKDSDAIAKYVQSTLTQKIPQ